jgi:hypothetical protein
MAESEHSLVEFATLVFFYPFRYPVHVDKAPSSQYCSARLLHLDVATARGPASRDYLVLID